MPAIHYRHGTQDLMAFREVYEDNEYRLPVAFDGDDVIVDVGAHIGAFALACLERGAGLVYCCEPDPDNFRLLSKNMADYADRAMAREVAVWRSDKVEAVRLLRLGGLTAMHLVVKNDAGAIPVVSVGLDHVLRICGPRIRLLKLDCEGSECPILHTSRELPRVDEIVGEYHPQHPTSMLEGCPDFSEAGLDQLLSDKGFTVEWVAPANPENHNRHFFARRVTKETCNGFVQ